MGCVRVGRWSGRLLAGAALCTMVAGCGSFSGDLYFGSRIGLRPDDPTFQVSPTDGQVKPACDVLQDYLKYAENLKEAYRSRATQNRTWIYVAAITGLGVAAASGGLAAATGVAAGTLALLAVSGGFTSATFATINNSDLANVYTVAANNIGAAMTSVEARVTRCRTSTGFNKQECAAQLAYLTNAISNARNTLETARTSSAAGALARATAQKTLLDQEITKATADAKARDVALKAKKAATDAAAAKAAADTAKETANAAPPADKAAADADAAAKQKAADKAKEDAKAAEAEAKAEDPDEAARAAATAPIQPPCLADSS